MHSFLSLVDSNLYKNKNEIAGTIIKIDNFVNVPSPRLNAAMHKYFKLSFLYHFIIKYITKMDQKRTGVSSEMYPENKVKVGLNAKNINKLQKVAFLIFNSLKINEKIIIEADT